MVVNEEHVITFGHEYKCKRLIGRKFYGLRQLRDWGAMPENVAYWSQDALGNNGLVDEFEFTFDKRVDVKKVLVGFFGKKSF